MKIECRTPQTTAVAARCCSGLRPGESTSTTTSMSSTSEEFLLGESEGAMAKRDCQLLGHRSTRGLGLPGPSLVDPGRGEPGGAPHGATTVAQQRTGSCSKPEGGPSGSLRRLKDPDAVEWDPHRRRPREWASALIGRAKVRRLAMRRV